MEDFVKRQEIIRKYFGNVEKNLKLIGYTGYSTCVNPDKMEYTITVDSLDGEEILDITVSFNQESRTSKEIIDGKL